MYYRIENNIIETDSIDFDFVKLGGVGNVMFNNMKRHGDKTAQVSLNLVLSFSVKQKIFFQQNYLFFAD